MLLEDYRAAVDAAETSETLWVLLRDYFRDTEVGRLSYIHLPPLGPPMTAGSRPKPTASRRPWSSATSTSGSIATIRSSRSGAASSRAGLLGRDRQDRRSRRRERALPRGVPQSGLGIRRRHPGLRPERTPRPVRARLPAGVRGWTPAVLNDYWLVCQSAHLRYCALIRRTLGPLPELSQRETEVLAWVARGKSNGLIGEILGISAHTVDAHLRRIYLKLGVFDRISAAVRGIGVGLIHAESDASAGRLRCVASVDPRRASRRAKGLRSAPGPSRKARTRSGSCADERAQPPADGLLDEPVAVGDVDPRPSRGCARVRRVSSGVGMACAWSRAGWRRGRRGGPTCSDRRSRSRPSSSRDGVRDQPALDGLAGVVGDRPGVEVGHPAEELGPDQRLVLADPGLGEQLGGGDARLVDVAVPRGPRRDASRAPRHVERRPPRRRPAARSRARRRRDTAAAPCGRRPSPARLGRVRGSAQRGG